MSRQVTRIHRCGTRPWPGDYARRTRLDPARPRSASTPGPLPARTCPVHRGRRCRHLSQDWGYHLAEPAGRCRGHLDRRCCSWDSPFGVIGPDRRLPAYHYAAPKWHSIVTPLRPSGTTAAKRHQPTPADPRWAPPNTDVRSGVAGRCPARRVSLPPKDNGGCRSEPDRTCRLPSGTRRGLEKP